MDTLMRVKPEQAGIMSAGVERYIRHIREMNVNLHSFMLLRHGKVAAECYAHPYHAASLHPIFSVSKSITSAAIGIAVGEGLLSLEDRIIDLFPDKIIGDVHPFTAMMKIKHLLSMQTVHNGSTNTDVDDWVATFLNTPPAHPPGTVFAYDTTATHTLCAVIQRASGMTVHDYLRTRLFDPVGIGPVVWESCPLGINKGGSGIRCTTEDMARFGQLYLQDGVWNGQRILPEGWVSGSTSKIVDNSNARAQLEGRQGYGYQFWLGRQGSYCAFGMGGQFILVVPDRQLVFATTANTLQNRDEHQLILDGFWQWIYPACGDVAEADALMHLTPYVPELPLHLPAAATFERPDFASAGARYRLLDNKLGFGECEFIWGDTCKLIFYAEQQRKAECSFALGEPIVGLDPFFLSDSASSAGWVDDRTLVLQIQLLGELQMFILTCCFTDPFLVIQIKSVGVLKTSHLEGELTGSTTG